MKLFSTVISSFALAMVAVAAPIGKFGEYGATEGLDSVDAEPSGNHGHGERNSGIEHSFDHEKHSGDHSLDYSFASIAHSHGEGHHSYHSEASDDDWSCDEDDDNDDDESDYTHASHHHSDHEFGSVDGEYSTKGFGGGSHRGSGHGHHRRR
ncbi:hypothetical protein GGI23_004257, partial [Coemansia sp. RSA 2559]